MSLLIHELILYSSSLLKVDDICYISVIIFLARIHPQINEEDDVHARAYNRQNLYWYMYVP